MKARESSRYALMKLGFTVGAEEEKEGINF
jgi:hypothetical protein